MKKTNPFIALLLLPSLLAPPALEANVLATCESHAVAIQRAGSFNEQALSVEAGFSGWKEQLPSFKPLVHSRQKLPIYLSTQRSIHVWIRRGPILLAMAAGFFLWSRHTPDVIRPLMAIQVSVRRLKRRSEKGQRLMNWAEANRSKLVFETQPELAERFYTSVRYISRILQKFNITAMHGKIPFAHRGLAFWAQSHKGKVVEETFERLIEQFQLPSDLIWRYLNRWKVTVRAKSEVEAAFNVWLEQNRDTELKGMTLENLTQMFPGISGYRITLSVQKFNISFPRKISDRVKKFRAWAEERRNQTLPYTREEVLEISGLADVYQRSILKEFGIALTRKKPSHKTTVLAVLGTSA